MSRTKSQFAALCPEVESDAERSREIAGFLARGHSEEGTAQADLCAQSFAELAQREVVCRGARAFADTGPVQVCESTMTGRVQETTLAQLEQVALAKMTLPQEPCEVVRQIEARDLPLLAQELRERNWQSQAPDHVVSTLRTGHQQLAQLLASRVNYSHGESVSVRTDSTHHN